MNISRKYQVFRLITVLGAILFLFPPVTSAKGTFNRVVIYGEGVAAESFDPSLLAFDSFNSFSSSYPGVPSVSSAGYLIVRLVEDQQTGELSAFDSLRFFPTSLGPGSKPYVYYEGLVNGWSEYDRKWFEANPEAAASLQGLLSPGFERSSPPGGCSAIPLVLSGLTGIAVGTLVTAVALRRRSAVAHF